jgi:hypothetical protein
MSEFLLWLVSGGCVIAASWALEQLDWFQNLTPQQKRYLQFGLSAFLGLGALLVSNFVPQEVLQALEPYFQVLASVFGMIFLNQAAHSLDPNRKKTYG